MGGGGGGERESPLQRRRCSLWTWSRQTDITSPLVHREAGVGASETG